MKPTTKNTLLTMTTHLDRLLFAQGGKCFFCRQLLAKPEASVEHLLASSQGGSNKDENCVVCCKTLNSLLGSKSIKEKMQIVLNQNGRFACPAQQVAQDKRRSELQRGNTPLDPVAVSPAEGLLDLACKDLQKRGASRPRRTSTLGNTLKSLLRQHQRPSTDREVANLIGELQTKGIVMISGTSVAYNL